MRSATPKRDMRAMRCCAKSSCSFDSVTPVTAAPNSVAAISASAPQPQPISSTRSPGCTPACCRARRTLAFCAQVVMGVDVFLAVGARVSVEQVLDAKQQSPGPVAVHHAFDLLAVGNEELEQVGQVRRGPVAGHVALGKADVA